MVDPKHVKLEDMTEEQLVYTAERDSSESRANQAMKLLRFKHHHSYIWCWDCDGLVIKQSECCLNKVSPSTDNPDVAIDW